MRRSKTVTLTLLAAVAFWMAGCDDQPQEVKDCVDKDNHIVADKNCDQPQPVNGAYPHGYLNNYLLYRWVFRGSSGGHIGDTVVGGRLTPSEGFSAAPRSSFGGTVRGGFGGGFHGGSFGE